MPFQFKDRKEFHLGRHLFDRSMATSEGVCEKLANVISFFLVLQNNLKVTKFHLWRVLQSHSLMRGGPCCYAKGRGYRLLISTHLKVKWDSQVAQSWCALVCELFCSQIHIHRWYKACRCSAVKISFSREVLGEKGAYFSNLQSFLNRLTWT